MTPEEEHIYGFGDKFYAETGMNPYYSPKKEDTPKNSVIGELFNRLEKAYEKYQNDKQKEEENDNQG